MYCTVPTMPSAAVEVAALVSDVTIVVPSAVTVAMPRWAIVAAAAAVCRCAGSVAVTAAVAAASTAPPLDRAMPKSMISVSPLMPIMMLAGLRSRWTTPALCAATRPDTIARASGMTSDTGSRPASLRRVAMSTPFTYDIVMYLIWSISPRS